MTEYKEFIDHKGNRLEYVQLIHIHRLLNEKLKEKVFYHFGNIHYILI